MSPGFKNVPAVDKCFAILELLARSKEPLGISDIASRLELNKSTVFSTCHTLVDLNVLENSRDGKFTFGTRLYALANMAGKRSALIQTAHPFLEDFSTRTGLSVFLGIRSDCQAILIDKVDSPRGINVSSEIGFQMPVLAGAGIKAMLAQLPDEELDPLLGRAVFKRYTPRSITDLKRYRGEIETVRAEGVAYDREEYLEGMVAAAIPIVSSGRNVQAAIWTAGLAQQLPDATLADVSERLRHISEEIHHRL